MSSQQIALNEALLNAVKENRIDLVHSAISNGSSLIFTDWVGYTALHLVAINDSCLDIGKLLLRFGANVNAISKLRKTPLHLACQFGSVEVGRLLVENGADMTKDILMMTPLHWAVQARQVSLVEILCSKIEDVTVFESTDKFGRTCWDMAYENKDSELLSILDRFQNQLRNSILHIKNDLKSQVSFRESTQPSSSKFSVDKTVRNDSNHFQHSHFHSMNSSQTCSKGVDFTGSESMDTYRTRQKVRKNYEALLDDIDSDESTDLRNDIEPCKKTKISSSPQDIEETLLWLQNQALANTSDDFILEDKQFYLTEAGVLTLEYLNRIDPIGDEQRLLLKLAKNLEYEDPCQQAIGYSSMIEEAVNKEDKVNSEISEDWFFNTDLNLDDFT